MVGGITSIDEIKKIFSLGIEKVSINSAALKTPDIIKNASDMFGSQSIVVSIDVRSNFFGNKMVYTKNGKGLSSIKPVEYAMEMEKMGAGELLINSVDYDGKMSGYDIELIRSITEAVTIPVIACGGAGSLVDLKNAVEQGGGIWR